MFENEVNYGYRKAYNSIYETNLSIFQDKNLKKINECELDLVEKKLEFTIDYLINMENDDSESNESSINSSTNLSGLSEINSGSDLSDNKKIKEINKKIVKYLGKKRSSKIRTPEKKEMKITTNNFEEKNFKTTINFLEKWS